VDLTPEVLAGITALDNVVAVCDFSGEPERMWRTAALIPEAVVMTGTDRTVVENVISGARAWVAALPDMWPEQVVRLFDLVASGHLVQARAQRLALDGPLRWKGARGEVQMVKFGTDYSGRYGGPCRPPRDALAADVLAEAHRDVQNSIAALVSRGLCGGHR
jgi:4-hydroxy-tetrahydrodipicolinate synthase